MDERELKEKLLQENKDFKEVYKLHQQCERELEKLRNKSYYTDEDRLNEQQLKKRKLILKDRMYLLMSKFRESLP